ncbi:unnamed protein product, partial [marine sediment metagenome]
HLLIVIKNPRRRRAKCEVLTLDAHPLPIKT